MVPAPVIWKCRRLLHKARTRPARRTGALPETREAGRGHAGMIHCRGCVGPAAWRHRARASPATHAAGYYALLHSATSAPAGRSDRSLPNAPRGCPTLWAWGILRAARCSSAQQQRWRFCSSVRPAGRSATGEFLMRVCGLISRLEPAHSCSSGLCQPPTDCSGCGSRCPGDGAARSMAEINARCRNR